MIKLTCQSNIKLGETICIVASGFKGTIGAYVRVDGVTVATEIVHENGKAKIYLCIPNSAHIAVQVVVSDGVNPQARLSKFVTAP